jgi:hypothetical protein
VVSKCQIAFESKAQADEKAQHTLKYMSILKVKAVLPVSKRPSMRRKCESPHRKKPEAGSEI